MPVVEAAPQSVVGEPYPKPPTPPPPKNTLSLRELEEQMKSGKIPHNTPAPKHVIFPDGKERELKYWRDLLLAVVGWRQQKLAGHVPITWPGSGRLYVGKDSSGMRAPKQAGPYWVETHASALYLVKAACHVLSVLGDDPAAVHVVMR
jgi:hypothetical protein